MKYIHVLIFSFSLFFPINSSIAAEVYFVDIKKILNESKAGKQAQNFLKKKFDNENKKFEKEGVALKKEETDLIAKKKLISKEEYVKNLNTLREKSVNFQKKRRKASNDWIKKKNEARAKLISALNPILQNYMKENKIEMIVDKKHVLLANSNLEITDKILEILNKEVKSINLN